MFYYRITRWTKGIPTVKSESHHEARSYGEAGEHVASVICGGYYAKVNYQSIRQADYIRATRPRE